MKRIILPLLMAVLAAYTAPAVQASMPGAPQVVTSGTNVYVAWTDLTPLSFDVFLRRSADGGATFSSPVNVSRNIGSAYEVALAADGDLVAVAWIDDTPGNREVFVAVSQDGGLTFGPAQNLSNDATSSSTPVVAVGGGRVHVAWTLSYPSSWPQSDAVFRTSTDGGLTFGPLVNFTGTPDTDGIPSFASQIVASGESVYVAWSQGGDLVLSTSHNGGAGFGAPVLLGPGMGPIAVSGNEVAAVTTQQVACDGQLTSRVFLRESFDQAASFGEPETISDTACTYRTISEPRLAFFGTGISVAWREVQGSASDVMVRSRPTSDAAWSPIQNLRSFNPGTSEEYYRARALALSATNAGPVVFWEDRLAPRSGSGAGEHFASLVMAFSVDRGNTFQSTHLADTSLYMNDEALEMIFEQSRPMLAATGSRVHAAYLGHLVPGLTVFLRTSADGGATFGGPGALNDVPLPAPAAATAHEAHYLFVPGQSEEPDPAVWTPSGTADVVTAGAPNPGWGISDPGHGSYLLYESTTPLMEDPQAVLVLRARSSSQYVNDGSGMWFGDTVGWRLMIDAPEHRIELLQSRTPTSMRQIRLDGATLEPPIDFPWDNEIENEYEIRRLCCTGEVVVTAVQGIPTWRLRETGRRYAGGGLPWTSGTSRFAWGTGLTGGGVSFWNEVHAQVLQPATGGVAECKAQIDRLVAQTQAAQFTGKNADKDRSYLLAKLAGATAKLDQGKFQEAVGKLTDFQNKIQQLLNAGKIAAADAGALLGGAALAIDSIQSL